MSEDDLPNVVNSAARRGLILRDTQAAVDRIATLESQVDLSDDLIRDLRAKLAEAERTIAKLRANLELAHECMAFNQTKIANLLDAYVDITKGNAALIAERDEARRVALVGETDLLSRIDKLEEPAMPTKPQAVVFETKMTTDPVCPNCGHAEPNAWEIDFGPGLDGDTTVACGSCGADYFCSRIGHVFYTTRQKWDRITVQPIEGGD